MNAIYLNYLALRIGYIYIVYCLNNYKTVAAREGNPLSYALFCSDVLRDNGYLEKMSRAEYIILREKARREFRTFAINYIPFMRRIGWRGYGKKIRNRPIPAAAS